MSADPRRLKAEECLGGGSGTSGAALLAKALSQARPLPLADLFRALRVVEERNPQRETRALREIALADNPPPHLESEATAWWPLHRLGLPEASRVLALESAAARGADPALQYFHDRHKALGRERKRVWVPFLLAPLLVLVVMAIVTEPRLAFIPLLLLWILPWWKRSRKPQGSKGTQP